MSSPAKNTKNYLWWIPNIVVSQSNLTVPVKNITWLKPIASQEVEMKQYNFTNNQFVLFNPGSLGRVFDFNYLIYILYKIIVYLPIFSQKNLFEK